MALLANTLFPLAGIKAQIALPMVGMSKVWPSSMGIRRTEEGEGKERERLIRSLILVRSIMVKFGVVNGLVYYSAQYKRSVNTCAPDCARRKRVVDGTPSVLVLALNLARLRRRLN